VFAGSFGSAMTSTREMAGFKSLSNSTSLPWVTSSVLENPVTLHDLGCLGAYPARVRGKPVVDANVAAFGPSQLLEPFANCCDARFRFRVVLAQTYKHANAAHSIGLLSPGGQRHGTKSKQCEYRVTPVHSIPRSAQSSECARISGLRAQ
jgi:hypothetical protein